MSDDKHKNGEITLAEMKTVTDKTVRKMHSKLAMLRDMAAGLDAMDN